MPAVSNPKVVFASIPDGMPVPGKDLVYDTTEQIDLDTVALADSGMLVKLLSISLDPYMRGKMNKPTKGNYTSSFNPGDTMYNFAVTEVLKSNDKTYPVGSKLYGIFKFQTYQVIEGPPPGATVGDAGSFKILENKEGLNWTTYVGAAGMPGKTAFYGLKALSKSKPGESIFVSSAYGPVGALVCQIAKNEGLKVIASAGSEEKVKYLREELGVTAFNYKTEDTAEQLEKFGGIDIFWDGVGTSTLDAALGALKFGGRAIECGMISGYNSAGKGNGYEFKNIMKIIGSGLTISGFLVFQYEKQYQEEFYKTFPAKLASGEYKFEEHVVDGLEHVPQAFVDMLDGTNKGKVVVRAA